LAEATEQPATEHEAMGGLADATLDVRFAGYCVYCDRIVERTADGSCPKGHPAEGISGRIPLIDGEPVPVLPRFNLAAFLIPPIWGPAHGQWVGAIFLPIWLFMDSIIASAGRGGLATMIASSAVVVCTLAFMVFFAMRANGLAYRRVCSRMSVEEYVAGQRWWIIASVPAAAALLGWAIWFHLVFEASAGR
jgi:hypothetical protein